jgi:hypothetical protein
VLGRLAAAPAVIGRLFTSTLLTMVLVRIRVPGVGAEPAAETEQKATDLVRSLIPANRYRVAAAEALDGSGVPKAAR